MNKDTIIKNFRAFRAFRGKKKFLVFFVEKSFRVYRVFRGKN